jgi:Ala-tRNA(Pro) deacylase
MAATTLIEKLSAEQIPYELLAHRHTETATAEARALGLTPGETAKTIVLRAGDELVRAVIPASARVDLVKAERVLGEPVEIVHEDVLAGAYPEFALGAVPPFGGPQDRVLVDRRLTGLEHVVFEAGTHEESIRLGRTTCCGWSTHRSSTSAPTTELDGRSCRSELLVAESLRGPLGFVGTRHSRARALETNVQHGGAPDPAAPQPLERVLG